MKIRKILIRIGVGLLIFIGVVLAARAVLNFTEGRALAKTLADLKARGIPLTAKDLAPPCADEDNGARLLTAFENITTIPGRQRSTPGQPARKNKATNLRGLIGRSWNDFTAGKPISPADRAELKEAIAQNAKAFDLLAEMVEKPCFLYRDPADSLVSSLIPNPIQALDAARLLFFSSLFRAEDGDVRGAVDRLVTGLKFGSVMAREGTLISYLVSVAESRTVAQFLGEICRGRAVHDEDTARLAAALDPDPWRDRLAASFRGERVLFIEFGDEVLRADLGDVGSIWEGPRWWEEFGLWLFRPLVKRDMRRSLPSYEWLETQAKIPYYQSREALQARDVKPQNRPWYAVLSKTMLPESESASLKTAQIEAIMLANRAGLACRLYKSRAGRYPETLDALVPGLLSEVPIDPFTGKPLVYRRQGEGFIVYSLGSNQKDDGGRMTYMITQLIMDKDDDWSWREDR